MAYYSGSANDMAAVRQALIDACISEGWAWNSGTSVLSKADPGIYVQLTLASGFLRILGRAAAASGDAPHKMQIGPYTSFQAPALPGFTWPLAYEIFAFDQEVYLVINYSVDVYQWLAFGKSTVSGLPGSGVWVGASGAGEVASYFSGIGINPGGNSNVLSFNCPALFWRDGGSSPGGEAESLVHSDLDGQGWWHGQTYVDRPVGIRASAPLVALLPNAWNSEAVLLPIRCYKVRPSGKVSLTADLEHARYTRNDNYDPGQIIVIGDDKWKVLPWFRKNIGVRNGGNNNIDHSGTLGWAIRYEGP